MNTASAARGDLATIGRSSSLALPHRSAGCQQRTARSRKRNQGHGEIPLSAPRHGGGSGGVHIQFIESGGNFALLKAKLYDNAYYYVQGSAEVTMSFINLSSAFNPAWSTASIAKVMARAQAEVKS